MRLLPSLFKNQEQPWQWASRKHPKTTSGRSDMFKTVFFDVENGINTLESEGETVVRGVRSERLFFEPGLTSSILEEAKSNGFPFKESVAVAMESEDPYGDFRRSMEEMVRSHGVKDWECLEELLGWYLKVNGKKNHGVIVGAFVDVLLAVAVASPISCSDSTSFSSAVSSLHSLQQNNESDEEEQD